VTPKSDAHATRPGYLSPGALLIDSAPRVGANFVPGADPMVASGASPASPVMTQNVASGLMRGPGPRPEVRRCDFGGRT